MTSPCLRLPFMHSRSTPRPRCFKRLRKEAGATSVPVRSKKSRLRWRANSFAVARPTAYGRDAYFTSPNQSLSRFDFHPLQGVYTGRVDEPQSNSSPRPAGPALRFVAAGLIVKGGEVKY